MKWVTREKVHVDRVACPWLIKRFVDPEAQFLFVPPEKIPEVVEKERNKKADFELSLQKLRNILENLS